MPSFAPAAKILISFTEIFRQTHQHSIGLLEVYCTNTPMGVNVCEYQSFGMAEDSYTGTR